MANRTQLVVEILTDTAKAAQGLNETASKFEGFAKKAAGFIAGAFAVDKLTSGISAIVKNAAELEQAVGSVDAVFKGNADAIHAWASDTTDSIRLPQREFEKLAALIGSQLKNAGTSMDDLAPKTKEIIQLGADLGAQFGTTASEGVAALSSALKGQYDPLDRYGVTLTATAVETKAFEMAQGDAALAATQQMKAQAALTLIMEQSTDAQGAAAREADTFSGQLESVKEKLDKIAGEIGGPMLGALGDLVTSFGDMAPAIAPVVGLLTQFITGIASLPGPVLAAAAGIGLLVLAWGPLTAFLVGGGAALRNVGAAFSSAFAGVGAATGGLGRMSATMAGVRSAASSMGTALMSAIGGFAGIATGVAAGALIGLVIWFGKLSAAQKAAESSTRAITSALVEQGGVWNSTSQAGQRAAVTQSEAFQALIEDGFSAQDAIRALTGTWDDWTSVQQMNGQGTRNLNADTIDLVDAFKDEYQWVTKNAAAQVEANKIMEDGSSAKEGAIVGSQMLAESEAEAARQADVAKKAQEDLNAAVKAAQDAASRTVVNRAIEGIKTAAENAQRAVDFLGVAIDGLTGGTRTYEAALAGFNKSASSTADTFTGIAEASGEATAANQLNRDAMVAWNVNALTQNKAGQDAYDSLVQLQGGYETLVGSAYASAAASQGNAAALVEAQNNAGYAYDSFIALASSMGISEAQAATLAANLGILDAQQLDPKIFQLIAEDEEARAKVAALQAAGVDPVTIHMIPDDLATPAIESAISYVDKNGSVVTIPLHADTDPAEATADSFTAEKRQTNEVAILANSAPARNAMIAFLADYSKMTLTATLNANSAPARAAMEAFRGDYSGFQLTATILGNSAPARQAISALENGNYSVTVKIIADASPYMATFNSLPTTKTITQNVVTIPAPAPAPAFAGGVTTLGRSLSLSAQPMATSSTSTGDGTVINVSGALDPDAVARQIESLLRRRDRRSSGPAI